EGQAHPQPAVLALGALLLLPEHLEDEREELGPDAGAVVTDPHHHRVAIAVEGDLDPPALLAELDGVREDVFEDLAETARIRGHGHRVRGWTPLEPEGLLAGGPGHVPQRRPEDDPEIVAAA